MNLAVSKGWRKVGPGRFPCFYYAFWKMVPPMQDEMGFVYVIGTQPRHRVKIGWSKDPRQRLTTLQVGSPQKLKLIASAPATQRDEKALHNRLKLAWLHGEWFGHTDGVRAAIRDIKAGKPAEAWGLKSEAMDRPRFLSRKERFEAAMQGLRDKGLL